MAQAQAWPAGRNDRLSDFQKAWATEFYLGIVLANVQ
jgi:hypothetical protein